MNGTDKTIYKKKLWLLCSSYLLFMASFNMIIPELPNYITQMGGGEYKGLIISLFAITAAISRPFSGKLTDTIGRLPVMYIGAFAALICSFLYPFVLTLTGFFILRIFHGISTGFKPTGTTAYLSDIIEPERVGELMGLLGVAGSIGMALGPAVGSWIAQTYSINTMFFVSSAIAFVSIIFIFGMKETKKETVPFSFSLLKIHPRDMIEKSVRAPAVTIFLTSFSFGVVLTVTQDFSDYLQLKNRGLFFTFLLCSSLFLRIFSGKASDKYGRVKLLKIAALLLCVAMIIIGFSTNYYIFLFGAVVYGISSGISSPSIMAWTADLAPKEKIGNGMSTLFLALELGITLGALTSGFIYNNNIYFIKYAIWVGAVLSFLAFVYLNNYSKNITKTHTFN
jgi:MFS family permease